jgi:hypothetical protein
MTIGCSRFAGPQGQVLGWGSLQALPVRSVSSPSTDFIWISRAPSQVKFFAWLLAQSRVHTRDVLLRKTILSVDNVGCPLRDARLETVSHMAFHCPVVAPFWALLDVLIPRDAHVHDLHLVQMPAAVAVAAEMASAFTLHWQRNAAVFRATRPSLQLLRKLCRDDATLWRGRFPAHARDSVDAWLDLLRASHV